MHGYQAALGGSPVLHGLQEARKKMIVHRMVYRGCSFLDSFGEFFDFMAEMHLAQSTV